ncbi:hypothetical protein KQI86_09795 [Clostridium sp. MSJ-11]|uniref:Flavodoxin-like domain-containing protein n=1 Tax=Clostridium mobile TaxID=2841512 RepID=A0ABS6EHC4_9CLOT|nr:flavodoxin [Clostridium mobile]MBU5484623.1 hypothetical protein [Clostridium mobile]
MNKKALIVYYSRTGNTKKVAEELGEILGCDVEEVIDYSDRKGTKGYIKSAVDAIKKTKTKISTPKFNPEKHDIIIIATPVWASTMANAIRTYIMKYRYKFSKVAFLTTQGSSISEKAFTEIKELCQKEPISTCAISTKEIKQGLYQEKLNNFASEIK